MALGLCCLGLFSGGVTAQATTAVRPRVVMVSLDAVLSAASGDVLTSALAAARGEHATCLLLELNSDGGGIATLQALVTTELHSTLPIVAYVGQGGEAGSGALYVLEAASVAAAAADASLGADHPLTLGRQLSSVVSGDTAASVLGNLALLHHRDPGLPEQLVTEGQTTSAATAVGVGAIDLIAAGPAQLLSAIDGRGVVVDGGRQTLHTANATLATYTPSGLAAVGLLVASPDLAFTLLLVALICLGLFLSHPGSILFLGGTLFAAAVGVAGLLLLPLTPAALALLLLGAVLLLGDIRASTHGALTAAGAIALAIGGNWLIDTSELDHGIDPVLLAETLIVLLAAYTVLLPKLIAARRLPYSDPATQLLAHTARTVEVLDPSGMVSLDGGLWNATATRGPIPRGTLVQVTAVDGLHLTVEPIASGDRPADTTGTWVS